MNEEEKAYAKYTEWEEANKEIKRRLLDRTAEILKRVKKIELIIVARHKSKKQGR